MSWRRSSLKLPLSPVGRATRHGQRCGRRRSGSRVGPWAQETQGIRNATSASARNRLVGIGGAIEGIHWKAIILSNASRVHGLVPCTEWGRLLLYPTDCVKPSLLPHACQAWCPLLNLRSTLSTQELS